MSDDETKAPFPVGTGALRVPQLGEQGVPPGGGPPDVSVQVTVLKSPVSLPMLATTGTALPPAKAELILLLGEIVRPVFVTGPGVSCTGCDTNFVLSATEEATIKGNS